MSQSEMNELLEVKEQYDFLLRIMKAADGFDGLSPGELFWRTDGKYAPYRIFVNCNDLFYWACSDVEEITRDNIELLEKSIADMTAIGQSWNAAELFCCRARKMRPQTPVLKKIEPESLPYFEACGPERTKESPLATKETYVKPSMFRDDACVLCGGSGWVDGEGIAFKCSACGGDGIHKGSE